METINQIPRKNVAQKHCANTGGLLSHLTGNVRSVGGYMAKIVNYKALLLPIAIFAAGLPVALVVAELAKKIVDMVIVNSSK